MTAILISEKCQYKFQNELDRCLTKGYKIQGQLVVTPCKEYSKVTGANIDAVSYSIIMVRE